MDPTTVFCPNLACPARGHVGKGNIGVHSRQEQRFICTQCHKTFTATKGTAFYHLRTPAEVVTLVLTLMAHGCPLQAIVVRTACVPNFPCPTLSCGACLALAAAPHGTPAAVCPLARRVLVGTDAIGGGRAAALAGVYGESRFKNL